MTCKHVEMLRLRFATLSMTHRRDFVPQTPCHTERSEVSHTQNAMQNDHIVFTKEIGTLALSTMKCSAIAWIARFRRDRFMLLIALLAGLGTVHILVRTATYGAAVNSDSARFLSTAMNFLAGEGWRDFADRPMVQWPPLFPLLLAAGGWVGIEPLQAGRWINAAAFGLTIFASGGWLRSHLRSRLLALAASVAIAASVPLARSASHLLTDSLFVLFTLLALIWLADFLHRGGRTSLLWAAVFTALAALTRYPGVVLIGAGVLVLLVRRPPPLAVRLKHVVVFGAVPAIPLAGVLTHNWAVAGNLTGRKTGAGQSPSDSLSQVVDVLQGWVVSPYAPDWLGYILWIAAGLVVVLAGLGLGMGGSKEKNRVASPFFGLGLVLPFGVFAVSYLAFLVAVVPFTVYQIIDSRYLLPIYVPLLLTAVLLLDRFLSIAAGWQVAVRCVVASLVLLSTLAHVGFSAQRNLILTARTWIAGYPGWNYNTARWQHSAIINYIQENPIDGKVYSNNAFLAWFWDRDAALGKYWEKIPLGLPRLARQMMQWTEDGTGAYIVWIENVSEQNYDAMDLRVLPGVEVVAELADGFVLRLTAVKPFDAERHRARKQRYVDQLLEQAGERVARSVWDVYRTGRKLTYFKEPCAPADVQAKFVLHVVPADPTDLPAHRKPYGFDNLGFYFDGCGGRVADQCVVIVQLPDYAIGRIRVGQWISAGNRTLWEAEFSLLR